MQVIKTQYLQIDARLLFRIPLLSTFLHNLHAKARRHSAVSHFHRSSGEYLVLARVQIMKTALGALQILLLVMFICICTYKHIFITTL